MADLIARTPKSERFVLIGHSLGARVIFYTLSALAGRQDKSVVEAHLFGGAVGNAPASDWATAASAVETELTNYHSANDAVLEYLYRYGNVFIGAPAVGREPIPDAGAAVANINVSAQVSGHGHYKANAAKFMPAKPQHYAMHSCVEKATPEKSNRNAK